MARNSEKHFVRLNRVFLEEQWKKDKESKRPPLSRLTSASDVKKWIPSIKKELDYCLQQLSGARKHTYPENKIKEFEERVESLRKEHSRFVMKVKHLDPSTSGVPWQPRGYTSKRNLEHSQESLGNKKPKVILTPLLKDASTNKTHHGNDLSPNDKDDTSLPEPSLRPAHSLVSYQFSESDSED